MNSMLIIASCIAMAVASPTYRGLVAPGMPGPTPIVGETPISIGPAIIDSFEPTPIAVGPALVDNFEPIAVGPAIIDDFLPVNPVVIPSADGTLVQIIINVKSPVTADVPVPAPVGIPTVPEVILPGPVNVVDQVDAPVVPEPVQIGNPTLPEVVIPGPVNVVEQVDAPVVPVPVVIGNPTLPEVVIPAPVIIGTPIIPAPAVVLPEQLN